MRLRHYSIHTECSYSDWIKRCILFHEMRNREELFVEGEKRIEAFRTDLAVNGDVAPSTQNQAMSALIFLYKKVFKQQLDGETDAICAPKKVNIPVVLSREEVASVIGVMNGGSRIIAQLLYGSGLKISEALGLRIHDIDFEYKQITGWITT